MGEFFYHRSLCEVRQSLRNKTTEPEQILWKRLRRNQLSGTKFRRQASIGRYVVDFYCPSQRLVIEVDGSSHFVAGAQEYDQWRTEFLKSLGLQVIRFTNAEVRANLDEVVASILMEIEKGK